MCLKILIKTMKIVAHKTDGSVVYSSSVLFWFFLFSQKVETKETSYGSIIIPKPHPDKSLQMMDHFILTTDMGAAEILPNVKF